MAKHLAPNSSKNKHLKESPKAKVNPAQESHGCSCGCCSCHDNNHDPTSHKKDILLIVLSALLFIVALLLPLPKLVKLIIFIAAYLVAGHNVLMGAARKILGGDFLDEDFLMSIASIGAFCIGEYPEAVMVMLLFRVGSLFESYALGKSRKSIAELMDIKPDMARLVTETGTKVVAPTRVRAGDIILVSPGERIPLDGEIIEGMSSIDTSSLTGESMPRTCAVGENVLSGCINISSPLKIKVSSPYSESTAARILKLVEGASAKKSRQESFISRFSRIYTPAVVIAAM